jgi:hypothetical protein
MPPAAGEIVATSRRMGDLIFTRARFGERTGYTGGLCDTPHWGLVTSGSLALETEDDIEVVTAGDVFACPSGPPGHRLLAADPASTIDLTPVDAIGAKGRLSDWRRGPMEAALSEPLVPARLELAALV